MGWGSSTRRGGGRKLRALTRKFNSLPWVSKGGILDGLEVLPGCPGPLGVFKSLCKIKFVRIFRALKAQTQTLGSGYLPVGWGPKGSVCSWKSRGCPNSLRKKFVSNFVAPEREKFERKTMTRNRKHTHTKHRSLQIFSFPTNEALEKRSLSHREAAIFAGNCIWALGPWVVHLRLRTPGLVEESLRPFAPEVSQSVAESVPESRGVQGSVPWGVCGGPLGPGLRSVPKVSL